MAYVDSRLYPDISLPDAWRAAWSRNQDGNPYPDVDRYTHTLTNSQCHSGAAITNADRNPDTYAGWANTCAEPRGGGQNRPDQLSLPPARPGPA
jgi:hypothetical protein